MREKYSIINSLVGVVVQFVCIIMNFVVRTFFIQYLGQYYLGINGLFSNILTVLSLSELGFGTAILFNMYKAVSEHDSYQIKCLLTFYAKIYHILACVIFVIGIFCVIILPYIIRDNPYEINYVRKIFLLVLINTTVSYIGSYRSSIIYVNQKNFLIKIVNGLTQMLCALTQILFLILTKDYVIYLMIQILFTMLNNLLIYLMVKKLYPGIYINKSYKLSLDTLRNIKEKVLSVFVHKISATITNGTDNIILSRFVGLIAVGQYSNYNMIISSVQTMVDLVIEGTAASMGNLMAEETREKVFDIYKIIELISFCITCFGSVSLLALLSPFIQLWLGDDFLLPQNIIVVLVLNFYIIGMRKAILITRNAGGLYDEDKVAAVVKPVLNLFFSVIGAYYYGILGVFFGTFISSFFADVIIIPYKLYHIYFNKSYLQYIKRYCKYFIITVSAYFLTELSIHICALYIVNNIIIFAIKIGLCMIISFLLIFMFFHKSQEFQYIMQLIKKNMKKIYYFRN